MLNLINEQIKKISTFIYILLILFTVFLIFNLNYKWEGLTIIVRVYLFIFSFFLVYNYSLIDTIKLRVEYNDKYGKKGDIFAFINSRVSPFLIIYFATIIFTLIDYIGLPNWPMNPILGLLDGRYSNNIIYSLILLVILRIEKNPKVTIPLFSIIAIFYFFIYKVVYHFSPGGASSSILKFSNFLAVTFFLIYEFNYHNKKIIKLGLYSILVSSIMYTMVVGLNYTIYSSSKVSSFNFLKSSLNILKMGYKFPFKKFQSSIISTNNGIYITNLIYYANLYKIKINYSSRDWEKLLSSSSLDETNQIMEYLKQNNIKISFKFILNFTINQKSKKILNQTDIIKYAAGYSNTYYKILISSFEKGDIFYKLWVIEVMKASKCKCYTPFLIDLLSNINSEISKKAYKALILFTGKDPEKTLKLKINSPQVIEYFLLNKI
jgi:hypothetical protein